MTELHDPSTTHPTTRRDYRINTTLPLAWPIFTLYVAVIASALFALIEPDYSSTLSCISYSSKWADDTETPRTSSPNTCSKLGNFSHNRLISSGFPSASGINFFTVTLACPKYPVPHSHECAPIGSSPALPYAFRVASLPSCFLITFIKCTQANGDVWLRHKPSNKPTSFDGL